MTTMSAATPATCGVAIEVPAAKKNVFTAPVDAFRLPQLTTMSWNQGNGVSEGIPICRQ
jgi:hypothetical protein